MRSLLQDVPRVGWLITLLITVRTAVMAVMILGLADLITAQLGDTAGDPTPALVVTILAAVVAGVLLVVENVLPGHLRARQEARWREQLARVSLSLGPDTSRDDAQVITEATDATEKASTYTVLFLGPYLAAVIAPVVVLIILGAAVSWPIAGLLLVGMLVIPVILGWASRSLKGAGAGYGRASGQLAGVFLESVRTLGTTMILNATGSRRARIRGMAEKMRTQVMTLLYRNQLMILVTDGAFGLATTTVAAVSALIGLTRGDLGVGEAVAVVLLARLLIDPVNRMGRTFYTGLAGKASLGTIRRALGNRGDAPDPGEVPEGRLQVGAVDVDKLTVARGERTVITDVSFRLPHGAHLAIVGPSGAGKSTLALALAGLQGFSGAVRIGGEECTAADLRRSVAYVPQSATLFSGTLADNLDLAGRGVDSSTTADILERARLPLDLRIGETGRGVSGGQAARISAARGLVKGAGVIVLDEATANLDTDNAALLRETARATGATLIEITHRPAEALDADLVLVLAGGHIQAFGPPGEIATHGGFFTRVLEEEQ